MKKVEIHDREGQQDRKYASGIKAREEEVEKEKERE